MFSSAGYFVNITRSALDPHTVKMLVCLQDWRLWHWTFNKLPGAPLEKVRINSRNMVLKKLTI